MKTLPENLKGHVFYPDSNDIDGGRGKSGWTDHKTRFIKLIDISKFWQQRYYKLSSLLPFSLYNDLQQYQQENIGQIQKKILIHWSLTDGLTQTQLYPKAAIFVPFPKKLM